MIFCFSPLEFSLEEFKDTMFCFDECHVLKIVADDDWQWRFSSPSFSYKLGLFVEQSRKRRINEFRVQ
jgi:hypothetical protein